MFSFDVSLVDFFSVVNIDFEDKVTEKKMGVRGLKTFLEREGEIHRIDIGDEIKKWKRYHRFFFAPFV